MTRDTAEAFETGLAIRHRLSLARSGATPVGSIRRSGLVPDFIVERV